MAAVSSARSKLGQPSPSKSGCADASMSFWLDASRSRRSDGSADNGADATADIDSTAWPRDDLPMASGSGQMRQPLDERMLSFIADSSDAADAAVALERSTWFGLYIGSISASPTACPNPHDGHAVGDADVEPI